MTLEEIEMVHQMIEATVAPLRMEIEAQSAKLEQLVKKAKELEEQIENLDNNTPGVEHYHDDYANVDHVERADDSLNHQLSRLQNDLSNLEYKVYDVERKAERAQSTADNASRGQRGYY